jgi:nucleolar GTP-binding protein
LFQNRPVILVINKIDIVRLSELSPENRAYVDTIISDKSVTVVETSTYSEEGVMDVRNVACDALLAHRVEQKLKGSRIEMVANKIHVAMPQKRDDVDRAPFIPDAVKSKVKYDKTDPTRARLERDDEQDLAHGAGVYSIDTKSRLLLSSYLGIQLTIPRELHPCRRFMEIRRHSRNLQRKEHCRLYRS